MLSVVTKAPGHVLPGRALHLRDATLAASMQRQICTLEVAIIIHRDKIDERKARQFSAVARQSSIGFVVVHVLNTTHGYRSRDTNIILSW